MFGGLQYIAPLMFLICSTAIIVCTVTIHCFTNYQ